MKFGRLFFALTALTLSTAARAQLIEVNFTGTILFQHQGLDWFDDRTNGTGEPFRFDAVYDSRLGALDTGDFDHGLFAPINELENHWRLRFGAVDIAAPISFLDVWSNGDFAISYLDFSQNQVAAIVGFDSILSWPVTHLPTPPFPSLPGGVLVFTNHDGFDLSAGVLVGAIDTVSARWLAPVPEPSTYALGAIGALAIAVFWRRRSVR